MKKYIQTTILLLAILLPASVQAHDFEVDGIYYNIVDGEAVVTYRGSSYNEYTNEYSGSVVIPESVSHDGISYPVTSIGKQAFRACSELTSISIPSSVTSIGNSAFNKCTGLANIQMPNSVTDIGCFAFYGTAWYDNQPEGQVVYIGLVAYAYKGTMPDGTTITIKDGTLGIAGDAFYNCTGLTTINIPSSVTTISQYAFEGCSGLTTINNPNSIVTIGDYAFNGCSSLTSINFLNSVTTIGNYAFYECTGLTNITIPSSVTSIGRCPFYHCTALTSIQVANENQLFDSRNNCNAIIETATNMLVTGCQNTVIPNSVTTIGDYAFFSCKGLTSIDIPSSITAIGYRTFASCDGLTSVTIPNSVAIIGEGAFEYCTGLTTINIPNSVTTIGSSAFSGCSGLTSVTIPSSVTSIGDRAFSNCNGLTSIIVDNGNPVYDSRDNCNAIIETATNTLVTGCQNTVIPNSVTTIGDYAFFSCEGLSSINIPNSVTTIGSYAFGNCTGLSNASIPNSVTAIGDRAFYGCTSLNDVFCFIVDPSQVSIGNNVFFRNYGDYPTRTLYVVSQKSDYQNDNRWARYFDSIVELSNFEINGLYYTATSANEVTVTDCNQSINGEVVIPETVTYNGVCFTVTAIGDYAFERCTDVTSITIPNTVISIGREAFEESGLTNILIPSSVTFIDEYAFIECDALQSMVVEDANPVFDSRDNCNAIIETESNTLLFGCQKTVIPNTVIAIGNYAFYLCETLREIIIPNSVTIIGDGAFSDCKGLTSVTIGNSVTTIGEEAFQCCYSLTSVEIPNSVTAIGFEAFAYCRALKSVTIGKSLSTIINYAFSYCDNLTEVYSYIADPTIISMGNRVFYKESNDYSSRTLHVPAGTLPLYQSSELWHLFFGQIVEMADQGAASDVNGDGSVNIGDVNQVINTILSGNQGAGGDVNKDGAVNISDVNFIINYILTH